MNIAYEASRAYTLFKLGCHLLAHLAAVAFLVTQVVTGGFVWASLVFAPTVAVYYLFLQLFGWVSSILFFIIFLALTFSMTSYNLNKSSVGEWIRANPQYGDFSATEGMKRYEGDNPKQDALRFYNRTHEAWGNSDQYWRVVKYKKDVDPWLAFDTAWGEFETWTRKDDKGTPPIPTPEFMEKYIERNPGRFPYKPI